MTLNKKTLKTLRHPNIVKYFYSEEPPSSQHQNHHHTQSFHHNIRCLVITEYIRPLNSLIESLNNEQIMHGIYGITKAIHFLHDRVQLSHNNLTESCIYLNSKHSWKLNDFELALKFESLNRDNLREIYEFKQKNAITPEEEAEFLNYNPTQNIVYKIDLNKSCKQAPHSIDAYAWAMTILNILPSNKKVKSFKTFFGNELNKDEDEAQRDIYNQRTSYEQLERFLNKDPIQRPTLKDALDIQIFDIYKDSTDVNSIESELFKIENLNDLDANFTKLINYLTQKQLVKEKLIDVLLKPFMFFSPKVREQIFPFIFIPKQYFCMEKPMFQQGVDSFYYSIYQNFLDNKISHSAKKTKETIEPFIEISKYKTFVIPRILNLMSMHSTQIRLVLLEYFPFYVNEIDDVDTLQYEILPEA